jgi:hypothetical protein
VYLGLIAPHAQLEELTFISSASLTTYLQHDHLKNREHSFWIDSATFASTQVV